MPDESEYLNIQQAADALGVTRRRIWAMVKEGQLPAIQNPLDRREKLVARSHVDRLAKFVHAR